MTTPVKIAVAGTHSTGKTTFLSRLRRDLEQAGYTVAVVADLGEQAARHGFPILHWHTSESTLWIMTRGISLELQAGLHADVVLVDRPVPDALGYYRAALAHRGEVCPQPWADYLRQLAGHHIATYDLLLRTELDPSIPLGHDKPRDHDARFRMLADRAVGDVLSDLGIQYQPLAPGTQDHASQLANRVVQARASRRRRPAPAPSVS